MVNSQQQRDNLYWYKDAIIYELHIKAFRDSDCDGIGDFEGLLEKLDYLQDLGVTAIWLLPFYPSPLQDDGYDIADYYQINPAYGNIKQFKKFLKEAHKRNLKVITELVINHTSDQHPWFQRARRAPKGSHYRDYYVWSDDPNRYKDVRIIFQDFELSNWTWDPVAQQYYWHRFFHHQPDLNYDNPKVQEEVFKIIDYWCQMGVDGFRLDAVPYLFERENTNCENLPETHDFLKKLRAHVDKKYPGTLLLAEANMWPEDSAAYFGDGDECQMNYHFPVMPRMFMALQMEDRYPITDIFEQTPDIPETCQWAIFLRNHDELTLEMVTDEERDYMYKVYVKDPRARINLGIRHRLAPLMSNNRKKIELLNFLLFSLPGTPIIYYGDEIGMGDNFYLGDRNGVRTPMQWSADRNGGFSESNPQRLYLPLIIDPQYHYESVNVEVQNRNSSSLLWWMKRLIKVRTRYKAFSWGDLKFINTDNAKVLVFTRSYKDETILVAANLSRFPQPVEIDLSSYKGHHVIEIFSKNKFPAINTDIPYVLTLGAHDCTWFSLEKINKQELVSATLPSIRLSDWGKLLANSTVDFLQSDVLPDYLMKMRWFGGKGRSIQGMTIVDYAELPLKGSSAYLLLVEVNYQSGLPEIYQLPVVFSTQTQAVKLQQTYPAAIIAEATVANQKGVIYDAIYNSDFQKFLFSSMAKGKKMHVDENELKFTGTKSLKSYSATHNDVKPKILLAEQSNSCITFDGKFFLKIYRKVDQAINPDLEITRFLTEHAQFPNIPAYIGHIAWKYRNNSIILGMMQEMVENSGDGWQYMLDQMNIYNERVLSEYNEEVLRIPLQGSITEPVSYTEMPDLIKNMISAPVAEMAKLLGVRTAEMHIALSSHPDVPGFDTEPFSLHYQRSLYSSFQTLVRTTYQSLHRNIKKLPDEIQQEANDILQMKDEILKELKKIYRKKIDVVKTRLHGDYHLGQVLNTGKDFVILDFEGEPAKAYSERRLKRSPLRDVAGMVRSFHYAAYGSLFLNNRLSKMDIEKLTPFAELWYHYMAGFFTKAYFETVRGYQFIPQDKTDLELLLQTYILEKSIYELNYELNNRPSWVVIPLHGIKAVMLKSEIEYR